jgi:hypothetical protein
MMAVLGAGAAGCTQNGKAQAERQVVPTEENAALQYWYGWWLLAEEMETTRSAIYTVDGLDVPEGTSSDEVRKAIEYASLVIDALIFASKMDRCDFGSRPEQAVNEDAMWVFTHLRPAREAANLLAVDAGRLYTEDESEKATERIMTIFRMAEHIGRDETLIPCIAGTAIFEVGASYTERFPDKFSDADRRALAEALGRFPDDGPFRLGSGVGSDAVASSRVLVNQIRSGQLEGGLLEGSATNGVLTFPSVKSEIAGTLGNTRAARLARERLVRNVLRVAEVGEKLAAAWDDAPAIETIFSDIASGEYGQFALRIGSYQRLYALDRVSRAKLNALRAWASGETETLDLPAD